MRSFQGNYRESVVATGSFYTFLILKRETHLILLSILVFPKKTNNQTKIKQNKMLQKTIKMFGVFKLVNFHAC